MPEWLSPEIVEEGAPALLGIVLDTVTALIADVRANDAAMLFISVGGAVAFVLWLRR